MAKELGRSIDQITRQPYIESMFWMNYLKIRDEQEYIRDRELQQQMAAKYGR